jgi:hypothetical protein
MQPVCACRLLTRFALSAVFDKPAAAEQCGAHTTQLKSTRTFALGAPLSLCVTTPLLAATTLPLPQVLLVCTVIVILVSLPTIPQQLVFGNKLGARLRQLHQPVLLPQHTRHLQA